jgi:hypothetical protein
VSKKYYLYVGVSSESSIAICQTKRLYAKKFAVSNSILSQLTVQFCGLLSPTTLSDGEFSDINIVSTLEFSTTSVTVECRLVGMFLVIST